MDISSQSLLFHCGTCGKYIVHSIYIYQKLFSATTSGCPLPTALVGTWEFYLSNGAVGSVPTVTFGTNTATPPFGAGK